jgi:hypothetical protein
MIVYVKSVDPELHAGDATLDLDPTTTVENMMVEYSLKFPQVDIKKLKVSFNNRTLNSKDRLLEAGLGQGCTVTITKASGGCCRDGCNCTLF